MTEIIWKNPPASKGPGRPVSPRLLEIAAALRANPGQWALVHEGVSGSQLSLIKSGKSAAFRPAGHFEATSRVVGKSAKGNPIHDIYVRFIGDTK